jgi:hypothetical protein
MIREGEPPYTAVGDGYNSWVKNSVDECIDRHPYPTPSPHEPTTTYPPPSPIKPTPHPTDHKPDCSSYVTTDMQCYN